METYKIQFEESELEGVMEILGRSNDIVINTIEPTSIGITLQTENAEEAYQALLNQIELELRTPEVVIVRNTTTSL